jgi:hypothetical protein
MTCQPKLRGLHSAVDILISIAMCKTKSTVHASAATEHERDITTGTEDYMGCQQSSDRSYDVGKASRANGTDGGPLQHSLPPVGPLRFQHPRPQPHLPRLQLAECAACQWGTLDVLPSLLPDMCHVDCATAVGAGKQLLTSRIPYDFQDDHSTSCDPQPR